MKSISCLVIGLALAACSARALVGDKGAIPKGPWGGDTLGLEVVADGADLEFECATGRITETFRLDEHGDFDMPGTFTPQTHGPSRDDVNLTTAARYKGRVRGDTMTLTLLRGDDVSPAYTLTRGRRAVLKKCG